MIIAAKVLRHIVVNKDISYNEEKQQTSSILTEVGESMHSINQETISIPLNRKLKDLTEELEKQQKIMKTLQLELKVNFQK
jgi:heterodisulfide reductase subunit C